MAKKENEKKDQPKEEQRQQQGGQGQQGQKGATNKPKGWHSRRYIDRTAHDAARERYQAEHGLVVGDDGLTMRQRMAAERVAEAVGRTPEEQLALLDRRLGKGKGAVRERQRLGGLINAGSCVSLSTEAAEIAARIAAFEAGEPAS